MKTSRILLTIHNAIRADVHPVAMRHSPDSLVRRAWVSFLSLTIGRYMAENP